MGDIYSAARKVVVVLSKESGEFLKLAKKGIKGRANLNHALLLKDLDKDPWVTRSWTYQEIANSKSWLFVAEGNGEETAVDGTSLLDALGNAEIAYRREYKGEDTVVRLDLPNISSFEDVLAECIVGDPLDKSALQIMSNVHRRIQERDEDYFNAMVGAVVQSDKRNSIRMDWEKIMESPLMEELEHQFLFKEAVKHGTNEKIVDAIMKPLKVAFAANLFMQGCETKGDYSFIYTTAERSKLEGQSWRPVVEDLKPICSWHSWGISQPGEIKNGQLELQKMLFLKMGTLNEAAQRFISTWVRRLYPGASAPASIESVQKCLRVVGFSSENLQALELGSGYFFPQRHWSDEGIVKVFVSSVICWVFGSPAVLVCQESESDDIYRFLCVGVFVGNVSTVAKESKECSVLIK
jgi:hypothetical protein